MNMIKFGAVLALVFNVSAAFGQAYIAVPESSQALNVQIKKDIVKVPYFFQVPTKNMASSLIEETPAAKSYVTDSPALIYDYLGITEKQHNLYGMGLRLTVLNGSKSRNELTKQLAAIGNVKTGDVILSFRPEWYKTLQYSHIQLGVSHAGVAFIENGKEGKPQLFNLDMPLDNETWRDRSGNFFLSSKHYLEAPYLHIVRPRVLHDGINDEKETSNIKKWGKKIIEQTGKGLGKSLSFNKSYDQPKAALDSTGKLKPLTFVADLGRLALGGKIASNLSMFCSEFAWSLLSLRNCDPDSAEIKAQFQSGAVPSCIEPVMAPMQVLGDLAKGQVGLADGPVIIASSMVKQQTPKQQASLLYGIVYTATGAGAHISDGHKAVQNNLLASDPKFFDKIYKYYVGALTELQEPNPLDSEQLSLMRLAFNGVITFEKDGSIMSNASGPIMTPPSVNYSPTAFFNHALLSPGFPAKSFDYVSTLVFADKAKYEATLKQVK